MSHRRGLWCQAIGTGAGLAGQRASDKNSSLPAFPSNTTCKAPIGMTATAAVALGRLACLAELGQV